MHVAICLSGNFRDYKITLKTFHNLINQFDKCDIFMLYDITEKEEDVINIKKILKPTVSKSIESLNNCNNINMWYKIKESYNLCKNYYTKKNIKYDLIIRARYDLVFSNKFNFRDMKIDNNSLYIGKSSSYLFHIVQKIYQFLQPFILEEFYFGTPKVMDKYMNFYDNIKISKNKCLKYRLSEIDFYIYSKLMMTDIVPLEILYQTYKQKNFLKYIYEKYKRYPNWFVNFFCTKISFGILIILIFATLYLDCKFKK